jgi:hypothetical protein
MEEDRENGKESSHSAHANGIEKQMIKADRNALSK